MDILQPAPPGLALPVLVEVSPPHPYITGLNDSIQITRSSNDYSGVIMSETDFN